MTFEIMALVSIAVQLAFESIYLKTVLVTYLLANTVLFSALQKLSGPIISKQDSIDNDPKITASGGAALNVHIVAANSLEDPILDRQLITLELLLSINISRRRNTCSFIALFQRPCGYICLGRCLHTVQCKTNRMRVGYRSDNGTDQGRDGKEM